MYLSLLHKDMVGLTTTMGLTTTALVTACLKSVCVMIEEKEEWGVMATAVTQTQAFTAAILCT